ASTNASRDRCFQGANSVLENFAIVELGQFRKVRPLGDKYPEQAAARPVSGDFAIEGRQEQAQQFLAGSFKSLRHLQDLLERGLNDAAYHGLEQLFLVLEIQIDRTFGEA